MSTLGKRSRSKTPDVSPPPLRRKTISSPSTQNSNPLPLPALQSPPDDPNFLRIFSWNVNGAFPFLQTPITTFFKPTDSTTTTTTTTQPYTLRTFLRRHHWPQILCLQELKIAATDHRSQRALEISANYSASAHDDDDKRSSSEPQYQAHFSLPTDRHNARGPRGDGAIYGVATLIRDDFLTAFSSAVAGPGTSTRAPPWDSEGRVLVTLLPAPVRLAIVNGYFVNGTAAAYRDSGTGRVVGTRHEWKREFQGQVRDECVALEREGWRCCVIGDVNVARGVVDGLPGLRMGKEHVRSRRNFEKRFFAGEGGRRDWDWDGEEGLDGVDVWRHLYGERRAYTYYPRGVEWGSSCDRVDLCIVSRRCVDAVVDMGILETREERGHSDHVPLWVSFDLEKLK